MSINVFVDYSIETQATALTSIYLNTYFWVAILGIELDLMDVQLVSLIVRLDFCDIGIAQIHYGHNALFRILDILYRLFVYFRNDIKVEVACSWETIEN